MSPAAEMTVTNELRRWSDKGGQKCDAHGEKVEEEVKERESNKGAGNYPYSGAHLLTMAIQPCSRCITNE